jgi:two-component system, sensor histidine kinase
MADQNKYLQAVIAELQESVAGLREENVRLGKLSRQADRANKAKSDFLAMISHEIRTPMNGVIGITELLLDTELNARQQHYAGLILTSARHLLTLINSLLDFSKIEADMMELEYREFDLRGMIGELMTLYTVAGQKKNLRIAAEIDPLITDRYVGDNFRIRQILINFLGNGIKFTEKGEVVLRVSSESTGESGEVLRFEVRDSGPGIPPDKLDLLFKPFSQLDSSSTRRYGGTGLGLSICQKLVELMGGRIGVTSKPEQGSTFWFSLPLPKGTAPRELQAEEAKGIDISPEKEAGRAGEKYMAGETGVPPYILIVEDEETNRFVLQTILEKSGARTAIARNGREAVDLAAMKDFDLIFMDCQMPLMDGFAATERIYAATNALRGNRPRVVALTADATDATRQHCKAVGMDDYLVKPIDFARLQAVLDTWLPGSGLQVHTRRHLVENSGMGNMQPENMPELSQIDERVLMKLKQTIGNVRPVIRVFLDTLPERLRQLEEKIRQGDLEGARRVAHTLKGSSSQFGGIYFANLCMRIETMAKNKMLPGMDILLEKIRHAADLLAEFLAEELDKK